MKKFIAALALVSTTAFAGPHHYTPHHSHGGSGSIWAPLIIGGVIGWSMSQSQKPADPMYNNSPRVYNIPTAPPYAGATPIYQQRNQWEPTCNCYVIVYAQIGWQ